jgi:hypothetical protein
MIRPHASRRGVTPEGFEKEPDQQIKLQGGLEAALSAAGVRADPLARTEEILSPHTPRCLCAHLGLQ